MNPVHILPALRLGLTLAALCVALPATILAQDRPTLQPEDYGRWETLGRPAVGPFARSLAYTVTRVDESSELRIRRLDPDTTWVVEWGRRPAFSPDGARVAWAVGVSQEEERRLREADEPVRETAWAMDLASGDTRELGRAASLAFDPTGRFLAVLGYAPDEPEGAGAPLRVLDLVQGSEVAFAQVSEMEWAPDLPLLAMALATGAEEGNGLQVLDARSGALRGLDASGATYQGLVWRDEGSDLAAFRAEADASEGRADVLVWTGLEENARAFTLAAHGPSIPDTLQVAHFRALEWSEDGSRLHVGLRPRPEESEEESPEGPDAEREEAEDPEAQEEGDPEEDGSGAESGPSEDPSTVQIWHVDDVDLVAAQRVRESARQRRTLLASWEIGSGRVVTVGHDLDAFAQILGDRGFERRTEAYPWGQKFGRRYHDVWAVELESGDRTRALEQVRYDWTSPDGRTSVWFDEDGYHARDHDSGRVTDLTAPGATFANTEWDTPTDGVLPPHGFGGWVGGGASVVVYDRFDVWRLALDGSGGQRLTQGAEQEMVHRVMRLDPDQDWLDRDSLDLTLRDEWTEDRGFGRWSADDGTRHLVMEPRMHRWVTRADSVDRVVYRRESRTDSPDLVVADLDFSGPELVAESNPFLDEYAWTRNEMVEYTNAEGRRLHGVLMYPAGHDPDQTYPMIVYAYEILSPQRHAWAGPTERNYYNPTVWTQQGYFVLYPDIVFRARDPGVSTAETMEAAIGAVDAQGLIDRDRVGFIGHSWGGYEATYLAARTNLFATAVAGAPLTDFVSFMGSIHWNPGVAETDHWETGQARMDVPYWEDPDAHERNSPIHGVHTMTTPLLMAHGDDDGVVEFFQATEFYNFARRAEREMVLLVYEGEDHGFRQKANQIDYHRRILEWFGHYLKDEEAPAWITSGIPWSEHEEERARVAGAKKGG